MAKGAFDEVVHAPNRLQICAMLSSVAEAEFGVLRDGLGVADSVTSKHLKVLADAGYVTISKSRGSGRARTWVSLTPSGRKAYQAHLDYLRELASQASERLRQ